MKTNSDSALLGLAAGLLLIALSPFLFSDGMFMDGLLYACVSRNLAMGIGDLWHLHLTDTLYPIFNEHPPLAFLLQAGFFRLFGDRPFVEALYSLSTFALSAVLMLLCWREIAPQSDKHRLWLPFSVWLIIPLVSWSISNNLLENTMMIFTTTAIWLFLMNLRRPSPLLLPAAGIALFLAFYTKGFVALFPLSLPFWSFWVMKNYPLPRFFKETASLLIFLILPFLLMFWLIPDSYDSLVRYLQKQVIGSLSSVQTVSSRFYILVRLLMELIPVFIILIISKILIRSNSNFKSEDGISNFKPQHGIFWLMIFTGLSGVLPIMISLKQSGFYMLAALPVIALAMSLLLLNPARNFVGWLERFSFFRRIQWIAAATAIVLGILLNIYWSGKIGRDEDKLLDVNMITAALPQGTTISVPAALYDDWSLQGYLERKAFISLDARLINQHEYYLTIKEDRGVDSIYQELPIGLKKYQLYQKISNETNR